MIERAWERIWRGGFCRKVDYGGFPSGAWSACENTSPMCGYRKMVKLFRFCADTWVTLVHGFVTCGCIPYVTMPGRM